MSSLREIKENDNDFLLTIATKGKILKKEKNGALLISVDCPQDNIALLKKQVFDYRINEATEELLKTTNQYVTERAKTDKMLQLAIAELKKANAEKELTGKIMKKLTALETKIEELNAAIIDSNMAQQRRHKYFAEYVWKFNNSTMQQLGDIGIRQAEFTQVLRSCKPTLQDVINYTNRGVEL